MTVIEILKAAGINTDNVHVHHLRSSNIAYAFLLETPDSMYKDGIEFQAQDGHVICFEVNKFTREAQPADLLYVIAEYGADLIKTLLHNQAGQ